MAVVGGPLVLPRTRGSAVVWDQGESESVHLRGRGRGRGSECSGAQRALLRAEVHPAQPSPAAPLPGVAPQALQAMGHVAVAADKAAQQARAAYEDVRSEVAAVRAQSEVGRGYRRGRGRAQVQRDLAQCSVPLLVPACSAAARLCSSVQEA